MADSIKKIDLAPYIDHTFLKPEATSSEIETLCQEAIQWKFKGVCTNSKFTQQVSQFLKNTDTLNVTVVGFPLGASLSSCKAFESEKAVSFGAQEIDMVISIGSIKEKNWRYVEEDIKLVCQSANVPVKVILETCLLTDTEIETACKISENSGATYVKTSTGFSSAGASIHHVQIMRKSVSSLMGVKASGGIKTYDQALAMINAGATRIGTSSGVYLLNENSSLNNPSILQSKKDIY